MKITINNNKPWFEELEKLKLNLIHQALLKVKGKRSEAAKILGCNSSTINYHIKSNPWIDVKPTAKHNDTMSDVTLKKIKALFELSYTISEISRKIGLNETMIRKKLKSIYTEQKFDKQNHMNKVAQKYRRKGMFNTDEILDNNRVLLGEILNKIQENKLDELTDEHLFYAQILFKNGFLTHKGEITEEGKNALYH